MASPWAGTTALKLAVVPTNGPAIALYLRHGYAINRALWRAATGRHQQRSGHGEGAALSGPRDTASRAGDTTLRAGDTASWVWDTMPHTHVGGDYRQIE